MVTGEATVGCGFELAKQLAEAAEKEEVLEVALLMESEMSQRCTDGSGVQLMQGTAFSFSPPAAAQSPTFAAIRHRPNDERNG